MVLRQPMTPSRQRIFPGLFLAEDLQTIGLAHLKGEGRSISQVTQVMRDAEAEQRADVPVTWLAIEHGTVLDSLASNLVDQGTPLSDDLTVTSLVQDEGCVVGVRDDASNRVVGADIVILGDEADPRLAEQVGLRPDWLPTQLMHIGKVRYPATETEMLDRFGLPDGSFRVISLRYRAEWGAWGNALLIPGRDSFTLLGAMLLEDEMASARHIREFLDEVEAVPVMAAMIGGFAPDAFFTEVVPIGGFDARHRFHTDGFLVASDLVGVTHPLNRDGLSIEPPGRRCGRDDHRRSAPGGKLQRRQSRSPFAADHPGDHDADPVPPATAPAAEGSGAVGVGLVRRPGSRVDRGDGGGNFCDATAESGEDYLGTSPAPSALTVGPFAPHPIDLELALPVPPHEWRTPWL